MFRIIRALLFVFCCSGVASAASLAEGTLTLRAATGTNTATALVAGLQPVSFMATAVGPTAIPASLTIVSGNGQTGSAGIPLAQPFMVKVTDAANGGGNPLDNISVTFTVVAGGGSVVTETGVSATGSGTTHAGGLALAMLILGPTAGINTVTAQVNGLPAVTFTAIAMSAPASITYVSGNSQTGTVGTTLSQPFVVKVTDGPGGLGNPLANVRVIFHVMAGGGLLGSSNIVQVSTDANGLARASLTLGSLPGTNTVSAEVLFANLPAVTFVATATANTPGGPILSVAPPALTFNAVSGGDQQWQTLLVSNSGTGALNWSASIGSYAPAWLSIGPVSGLAPSAIIVKVNPPTTPASVPCDNNVATRIATCQAMIIVVSGNTTLSVPITVTVWPSPATADFILSQDNAAIQASAGSTALQTKTIAVSSAGAPIAWTAGVDSQAPWLSLGATSGTTPGSLVLQANPAGLAAGQYAGAVTLSAAGAVNRVVNVSLSVNPAPKLAVVPAVINFGGAVGGAIASQTIQVRTASGDAVPFTATVELPTGRNWLAVASASGTTPGSFTLSANPSGLAAGTYGATLSVTSPNAANRATATVLLQLSASNALPVMDVSPGGVLLIAQANGKMTSQDVAVTGDTGTSFSWSNVPATSSGGTWLTTAQSTSSGSGTLTIRANPAGLAPGLYLGQVSVVSPGTVNPTIYINVTLLVTTGPITPLSNPWDAVPSEARPFASASPGDPINRDRSPGGPNGRASDGPSYSAAAGSNLLVVANPAQQPMARTGFPRRLEAYLVTADGNPVSPAEVSVSPSGEPRPIPLGYQGNGLYAGVWTPQQAGSVFLRFSATRASDVSVPVNIVAAGSAMPVLFDGGAVNGASFAGGLPITAGSIVSIFGANLVPANTVAQTFPLPTSLGGVTVTVNGMAAPLFFVSSGQINLQIPFELAGQTSAVIRYGSGDLVSVLANVPLAPVSPGIFRTSTSGQGAVIHQGGRLVDASAPATAGEWLSLFVTGLGGVSNPPVSGAQNFVDKLSPTTSQPTVTIGGVPADVDFSGLAPGFVALYQINAKVPAAVAPAVLIPVVIRMNGVVSNSVTIAVK